MFPFVLLLYDRLVMAADAATRRRRLLRVHAAVIGLALAIGGTRLLVLLFIEHPVRVPVHWSLLLVNLDVVRRYLALITDAQRADPLACGAGDDPSAGTRLAAVADPCSNRRIGVVEPPGARRSQHRTLVVSAHARSLGDLGHARSR